jgi:hypothetical protein
MQESKKIISISGLIGSGKDTIADLLVTYHGFKRLSFASSLKDAVSAVFGWDREMLEGTTKSSREWREQVDPWWAARLDMPHLTPRWILQYWGTDVCRNHFHDSIWIASVEHKLLSSKDNIVITDSRFVNELDAVKRAGGITLRVTRGPNPEWYEHAIAVNKGPTNIGWAISKEALNKMNIHPSEYSSVGLNYDHIIDNNGTIDELRSKIESIIDF